MRTDVCIIGAGPAGLMAAIHSAIANAETVVIEGNTAAGRKLLQSGAGRCNFTHLASPDEIARAFGPKGRFLSYSLHRFTPEQVRQFFRELGLESKVEQACSELARPEPACGELVEPVEGVEPNGCVFPVTDRAGDVRDVLVKCAESHGVHFYFGKSVKCVVRDGDSFAVHTAGEIIFAKKMIITTGGLSYPQTGSTGDGYRFARELGHRIIEPKASLVPLVTRESWPGELAGASLEDVKISAVVGGRKVVAAGPMIFTDDGIGGPAVLDLSRFLTDYLPLRLPPRLLVEGKSRGAAGLSNNENPTCRTSPIDIYVDVMPGVGEPELDKQIRERIVANPKKTVVGILAFFLPRRAATTLSEQFNLDAGLLGSELKKDLRKKIVRVLKALPLFVVSTRSIDEAVVTRGGVSIEQVQSKTMESKISRGVFFAGEVLDVDGPCGGYNLQMCWSTGALAGAAAAI